MRLRTVTRAASASAIASLVVAGSLTWAPPARSLEQDRLTVGPDQVAEAEYGPLVNSPTGPHLPDDCRAQLHCDAIPLDVVVPPGLPEDDEYFVAIVVEWDTTSTPGDPVAYPEGRTTNDIDAYVYTDPPTQEEAERRGHTPASATTPYVAAGATVLVPEQAFLFNPDGRYWIVVENFLGVNRGYTVTVTWYSESFRPPVEKLAPELTPPTTAVRRPRSVGEGPRSRTSATIERLEPSEATTPSSLPMADIADDDFAAGDFDTSDFEQELAAPAPVHVGPIAARPDPPSNLALFFWLLAIPLGTVAVGGALITRRRAIL